jgi:DNA helicase-2/ATP-dependent DNA helicase PcrA
MDILSRLNPEQKEAVTYLNGPLLILAGAGSGKTRVLTHRLAYLVGQNICSPWEILAVTFTNKAAGEMKKRVGDLIHRGVEGLWVGTFHSTCARILRKEGYLLGYNRDYTIYDENDKQALIKKIMNDLAIPERKIPAKAVMSRISSAKDNLIGPEEYQKMSYDFFEKEVSKVYSLYQQELLKNQAMDFDDLIFNTVSILANHEKISIEYGHKFRHILVDEYQDTNHAQYMLVKLLSDKHRQLCVVGDDDQSIYGFRGADIRNILEFEKDFPEAKTIRLEQNYRSTKIILECANEVVKNNTGRKGKELWTENSTGEKVALFCAWDERDEADKITRVLKNNRDKDRLKDHVILYRTNAQSRALEDSLRRAAMPYLIVGGLKFYERKEIKDILSYLRVVVNQADSVSLKRIINVPPRGIGETSLSRIENHASEKCVILFEALKAAEQVAGLGPGVKSSINAFVKDLEDLIGAKDADNAQELISRTIEKSGYLRFIGNQYLDKTEADNRTENVQELVSAANDFCERSEDKGLAAFLAEVSLVADIDRWDENADAVTLMTIHNAKGLEFKHVFIAGLEEGLMPHVASLDTKEELEEERRLFYVAITRAQNTLNLCYAMSRRRFGGLMQSAPSRFIAELPRHNLDASPTVSSGQIQGYPDSSVDYHTPTRKESLKGKRVTHEIWGQGKIMDIEGEGDDMKLSILFNGGIKKKIMASFVEIV